MDDLELVEIKKILRQMLKEGKFKEHHAGEMHIHRMKNFELYDKNIISFEIERHPRLKYDAFRRYNYNEDFRPPCILMMQYYEVDLVSRTITGFREEKIGVSIDYSGIAISEVISIFNNIIYDYDKKLSCMDNEDSVLELANTACNSIHWVDSFWYCSELPDDFETKLLHKIKSIFVDNFLKHWKSMRDSKKNNSHN